tara:strand:+ start:130 stop:459 length:330 start_codon:yes stop_codon:yes gene_type:complete
MENEKLGKIGLWLAILGMILPILIALLCQIVFEKDVSFLVALLFLACEVSALGCGIASRQSGPGRAAVIVSAVSLVLSVLIYGFLGVRSVESTPSPELNTESTVSPTDD